MQYTVHAFGDMRAHKTTAARVLNSNPHMETQICHMQNGDCLNIPFEAPEDFLSRSSVMYIVLDGAIEVCDPDESQVIPAGSCIVMYPQSSYSLRAREESNVLCVTSDGSGDLDINHPELTEAVALAEKNDSYLAGHNYRVSRYTLMIMQLIDPKRINSALRLASGFHDVGKAKLDPAILSKPGKLTDAEYEHVKLHSVYSWELLRKHLPEQIANIARWHHEKLDGSGYPDHLRGDSIPLESRVIAVADIFDALTTSRCYRGAFTFEKALNIIQEDVEHGKLDGQVFDALRQLVQRGTLREGVDNLLQNGA